MGLLGGSYRRGPSTAFKSCEDCLGHGFLRSGDFANRAFPICKTCEGIGQIYLEKPPPPPPDKVKPTP